MIQRGIYDPAIAYAIDDVVTCYGNQYINLDGSTGVDPADPYVWSKWITAFTRSTGPADTSTSSFSYLFTGNLSVSIKRRRYFLKPVTVRSGIVSCISAPVGASITGEIVKNGTTVIGTFVVPSGSTLGTVTIANGSIGVADYLTINITQIGSTVSGGNMTLQLNG